MSIFETAIQDIFNNSDFLEHCFFKGEKLDCICSAVDIEIAYEETGMVDDISFKLDLKLPLSSMPKINDNITFRGKKWRIKSISRDSADTTISLYVMDVSKA